jgi:response regulator RpfG family c-di-GMP phosphodiesterase
VLRGQFDPRAVRGKIVVVGASAPTLKDVSYTPTSGAQLMAGAEIQANAIRTALRGLPLRAPSTFVDLLLIALLGIAPSLLRLRLRVLPAQLAAIATAVAVAYAVAVQLAFDAGVVLPFAVPMLGLVVGIIGVVIASQVIETRLRQRVARDNELLEARVRERTRELRDAQREMVHRLAAAVEYRDPDTGRHIDRMSQLAYRLGRVAGMSRDEAELLRDASAMHDVGKVGLPDAILHKPGRLDPDEWDVMKRHTATGAAILGGSRSPLLQMAETIALTHHERWDGRGYPRGLAGVEIPLVGRICAICDVYDALLSKRPYKDSWSVEAALDEIETQAGRHFDPRLVALFLKLVDRSPQPLVDQLVDRSQQASAERSPRPRFGASVDEGTRRAGASVGVGVGVGHDGAAREPVGAPDRS